MASERGNFFVEKFKQAVDWTAEIFKKGDIVFLAIGGVVFVVHSVAGTVIIIGSVAGIVVGDKIQRWARKK